MKTKLYTTSLLVLALTFARMSFATDTIPSGSFLVNMGVSPQTVGNGLKPYGMIYQIMKEHHVPVYWVINQTKSKDGIDLVHNGIQYRGGVFIIPANFRTTEVNETITAWVAQGVVGNASVTPIITDVYKKMYFAPRWTIEKYNGQLILPYFKNAGIPADAYGGDSISDWKDAASIDDCDDIFVMPHADPTWATHQALYYWNKNNKGNIWAGCHGVSAMESLKSPDGTIGMNFLTTNGLVPSNKHKKESTPPFSYSDPTNPIMQFVGTLDGATLNGSERIFLPSLNSEWRSTTTTSVYDLTDRFIPSLSNGPGAVVAYGRAFGDATRGHIMYQSGHDLMESGTVAEQVAAQRAFFNYSFFVAADRYSAFDVSLTGLPEVIPNHLPVTLQFNVPSFVNLANYTVNWTTTGTGTFSQTSNPREIVYTPGVGELGVVVINVSLTDGCSRSVGTSQATYATSILASGNTQRPGYSSNRGPQEASLIIVQNPVVTNLTAVYTAPSASTVDAVITDAEGKLIRRKSVFVSKGKNTLNLATRNELNTGVYFLKLQQGTNSFVKKIIVK